MTITTDHLAHCSAPRLLRMGFFTDDFGDAQDILFAPGDVFERWQYFLDETTQYYIWSQENA